MIFSEKILHYSQFSGTVDTKKPILDFTKEKKKDSNNNVALATELSTQMDTDDNRTFVLHGANHISFHVIIHKTHK